MSENAVETFNLGRKYGDVWGLKSANFTVRRGELVVLVGSNGAGKTTTVKILTTILKLLIRKLTWRLEKFFPF